MLGQLVDRFEAWQERMSLKYGTDISTPQAKKAALWHLQLHDHAFLRKYWTNLAEIAPGIWRSNQPSPQQLRKWHQALGLRSVLNLRGRHKISHWLLEDEVCRDTGIQLVDLPMDAWRAPRKAEIDAAMGYLQSLPRPLLFHCKSGADRTGITAALYLALIEGRPVAEAKKQLSFRFIHRDGGRTGVLDHVFRVYERDIEAKGVSLKDWLYGAYDPEAIDASYARYKALGPKGAW